MLTQVVALILIGVVGLIAFQTVKGMTNSLCANYTSPNNLGDIPIDMQFGCWGVSLVVALGVVNFLFVLIGKAAQGLE